MGRSSLCGVTGLVTAGTLVAGCGGGSSAEQSTTPAPAKSSSSSSAQSAPKASSRNAKAVTIKDFAYHPAKLSVSSGTTVTWTNTDSANHTVDFKSSGPKDIPNLRTDQKGMVTFKQAGTYAYTCDFHPNMHGTVVVK